MEVYDIYMNKNTLSLTNHLVKKKNVIIKCV